MWIKWAEKKGGLTRKSETKYVSTVSRRSNTSQGNRTLSSVIQMDQWGPLSDVSSHGQWNVYTFISLYFCKAIVLVKVNSLTFPWKEVQSELQPPVGTVVGAAVLVTKLTLLLQIEGNCTPQLISFQYPEKEMISWNPQIFVSNQIIQIKMHEVVLPFLYVVTQFSSLLAKFGSFWFHAV